MRLRLAVQRALPKRVRNLLRTGYVLAADGIDTLLRRRDELVPPRRRSMAFVGGGDYRRTGDEFLRYFTSLGGLQPDHTVLDIGCGIGRMALPLTTYLNQAGGYEGFDIVGDGIQWCRQHITPKYPNFHFQIADIYNKEYHPHGTQQAETYRFPYPDATFDFTFLISVFTHMLPGGLENYLNEIARTLKPGGRCLCTFFLQNDETRMLQQTKGSILPFLDFRYDYGIYHTINQEAPEAAIAYDETYLRGLLQQSGLTLMEPIRYGAWCGRQHYLSGQDIVLLVKQ